ncbi:MAG: hypothetical protein JSS81_07460 [Acidobacteria bacterium]|nr:hypothetical protein [Acidobacteriota bacterium]
MSKKKEPVEPVETKEPEATAVEPAAELIEPYPLQTLPLDEAIALGKENLDRILEAAITNGAPHRELICRAIKHEPGTIGDGQEFDYYITGFPDGTTGAELV